MEDKKQAGKKKTRRNKNCDFIPRNKPNQDPFFYAKDQKALENMASVYFNQIVGDQIFSPTNGGLDNLAADVVPYACVLRYNHAINAEDLTVGKGTYVQRAADAFFNYFTQGFTSGVNFEAPDVLMAVIAAASLSAVMIEGKRPYGLMHTFMQWNKGYARDVVNALGIDYNDLKQNLAKFRTQYNLRVDTFNKTIAIPKSFMLLLQWGFIAGNVFSDTSSPEYSSLYFYKLENCLKYNPTKLTTGTCLTWFKIAGGTPLTVDDWFTKIDELFATFNDSDVREMFGAIRRVYSEDQLLKLTEIDDSFSTPVVLHDTVNAQFHNAGWFNDNVLGGYPTNLLTAGESDSRNVALYQLGDGSIRSSILIDPIATVDNMLASEINPDTNLSYILDMYDHMENAGAVIDLTAYMNFPYSFCHDESVLRETEGTTTFYVPIYRSTINIGLRVISAYADTDVPKALNSEYNGRLYEVTNFLLRLTHLDSHPLLFVTSSSEEGAPTVFGVLGELDKYTKIPKEFLMDLDQQSLFQLLSMPANSRSVTR
nr:putative capsid [Marmot picobirnavirus]